ncbi:MAG TPA: tetratricopeptide repeat protein [Chloroflexota bacterium]|nr:tetratricopeptide repeat protein [Chloroflexota bacterium]
MKPHRPTFGELLRGHRVAAGLSQEALAEQTGLSTDAVGLLERGARRRPQQHTLDVLADTLALDGEERNRFLAAARAPAPLDERAPIDRVPRSLTPILGREGELQEIAKLFRAEVRLLTLTGPGGVGKTRLALAAAEQLRGVYADGVVFVPLAPIADSSLVLSTIARALDVPEVSGRSLQEGLDAALADRELLLVIDNFEHVMAAAPEVADLVTTAPSVRVLVTSRSSLRVRAERELAVPPLPVPAAADASDLAANPAVALYASRASAALPGFSLTPTDAAAVAAICRRLDGLPLAIELAAGRAKVLPPEALLARLDRGTAVLGTGPPDAPARHQSLAATLAWSHGLLGPAERAVFRRLAVFRGGWTLEAAETVCAGAGLPVETVLDGLAILADQSLVLPPVGRGAHPRFHMLETIREYAGEQLAGAGEAVPVCARHAACLLAMAEAAASQRSPGSAGGGFARLDPEHDNLRAALRWAWEQGDARLGLRRAAALATFWFLRGHYAEGRGWLERFLRMDDQVDAVADSTMGLTRAHALEGLAALVYNQGEYSRAAALYEQSITRYRDASDVPSLARALTGLGGVVRDAGDRARAVALLEESLALYRTEGDPQGIAHTLANLGSVVYFEGDFGRAEALLMESVTRYRDLGDETGLVFPMRFLALTHAERGRFGLAAQVAEESLALSRAVGDRGGEGAALNLLGHLARDRGDLENACALLRASLSDNPPLAPIGIAASLEGLAGVEAAHGRAPKAARLLGAASKLRGATGDLPASYMTRRVAADRTAVRSTLGAEGFGAAWDAGQRLSLDAALHEALRDDE